MIKSESAQERYKRIVQESSLIIQNVEKQVPALAERFNQVLLEYAAEVGEEYAEDFKRRLIESRGMEGWVRPDLLEEIALQFPDRKTELLDRFQELAEERNLQYRALLQEAIEKRHTVSEIEDASQRRWSKIRNHIRSVWQGYGRIHI